MLLKIQLSYIVLNIKNRLLLLMKKKRNLCVVGNCNIILNDINNEEIAIS